MTQRPLFIRSCLGEETERTPIWLMRQAGRYMDEYMAIRKNVDFWTLCQTPELACEVTLQHASLHFNSEAAVSLLTIPLSHIAVQFLLSLCLSLSLSLSQQ